MNDFVVRTLTSVVFVVVMVLGLLWTPYVFGALFLVIMLVAMQEYLTMSVGQRLPIEQKLTLLTAATLYTLVFCHCCFDLPVRYLAFSLIPFLLIPLSALTLNTNREDFGAMAYLFFAIIYIGIPISLGNCLVFREGMKFDGHFLLGLFIVIWACDVGAYCIGTALGQKPDSKKLAPQISPKKSWWGFWGGLVFGTVAAVVLHYIGWMDISLIYSIFLGILISLSAVLGDLFESMWKRYFGYKDSGNCMPGHGGMLDRFDSSIAAIPVATLYLMILGLF